MNIQKEWNDFKSVGYEAIEKKLVEEKRNIHKKQYFFKVVKVLDGLKLLQDNWLSKEKSNSINFIALTSSYEPVYGRCGFKEIELFDSKKEPINKYNSYGNYSIDYENIYNLLEKDFLF